MTCKTKLKNFGKKALNHIKDTSCHGIGHFANASHKNIRIFWFLCSIVCIATAVFFIVLRIEDYMNASIVRITDYEDFEEFDIPNFSICSENNYDDTDRVSALLVFRDLIYESLLLSYDMDKGEFSKFLVIFLYNRLRNYKLIADTDLFPGLKAIERLHYTKNIILNYKTPNDGSVVDHLTPNAYIRPFQEMINKRGLTESEFIAIHEENLHDFEMYFKDIWTLPLCQRKYTYFDKSSSSNKTVYGQIPYKDWELIFDANFLDFQNKSNILGMCSDPFPHENYKDTGSSNIYAFRKLGYNCESDLKDISHDEKCAITLFSKNVFHESSFNHFTIDKASNDMNSPFLYMANEILFDLLTTKNAEKTLKNHYGKDFINIMTGFSGIVAYDAYLSYLLNYGEYRHVKFIDPFSLASSSAYYDFGPTDLDVDVLVSHDSYLDKARLNNFQATWLNKTFPDLQNISTYDNHVSNLYFGLDPEYPSKFISHLFQLNSESNLIETEAVYKSNWMTKMVNLEIISNEHPKVIEKYLYDSLLRKSRDAEDNGSQKFLDDELKSEFDHAEDINSNHVVDSLNTIEKINNFTIRKDRFNAFQHIKTNTHILLSNFAGKKVNASSIFQDNFISHKSNNCLRLKNNNILTQTSPGELNGLELVLFIGSLGHGQELLSNSFFENPNFKINVESPDGRYFDLPSIIVSSQQITEIKISKNEFTKSSTSGDECVDDKVQSVSFEECKRACFSKIIEDKCGCTPAYTIQKQNGQDSSIDRLSLDECTFENFSKEFCFNEIIKFKKLPATEIKNLCSCHQPCQKSTFTLKVQKSTLNLARDSHTILLHRGNDYINELLSTSNLTFQEILRDWSRTKKDEQQRYLERTLWAYSLKNGVPLKELETSDLLSDCIGIVKIYFDNFRVEKVTEVFSDVPSSLVSDLGGQLGLWMGVSMVSILEVIVCVAVLCR